MLPLPAGRRRRARRLIDQGRMEEAVSLLSPMAEKDGASAATLALLGKAFFKMSRMDEAKKYLARACENDPPEEILRMILEISNHRMVVPNEYYNAEPSFSPDGWSILFASARRDTNGDGRLNNLDNRGIYLVSRRGYEERCLVPDTWPNSSPRFSPRGDAVGFLSRRLDTNKDGKTDYLDAPQIYLYDLETGREKCLLSENWTIKHLSFSPDGKRLLFCAWRSSTSGAGIFEVDRDGRVQALVPEAYENTCCSWDPTGERIVYASWRTDTNGDGRIDMRDRSAIYLRIVEQERDIPLVEDAYDNAFPVWSPDGRWIYFLSRRRDTNGDGVINSLDNFGIYRVPASGGEPEEIVSDRDYNKYPLPAPDGRHLFFQGNWRRRYRLKGQDIRDRFENKGIYRVEIGKGRVEQIVSDKYWSCAEPAVSAKGEICYAAFRRGTRRGIHVVNPEFPPSAEDLRAWILRNL